MTDIQYHRNIDTLSTGTSTVPSYLTAGGRKPTVEVGTTTPS
jgi:hypothetical protein